jgi:hypothetical protein
LGHPEPGLNSSGPVFLDFGSRAATSIGSSFAPLDAAFSRHAAQANASNRINGPAHISGPVSLSDLSWFFIFLSIFLKLKKQKV